MHWPKRRKAKRCDHEREEELRCARQELRDVEHSLEAARRRQSEIEEISHTLRGMAEENHFALLVREAFESENR